MMRTCVLALLFMTLAFVAHAENNNNNQEEERQIDLYLFNYQDDDTCGSDYADGFADGYEEGYNEGYEQAQADAQEANQDQNQDNANQKQDADGAEINLDDPECVRLELEQQGNNNNNNNNGENQRVKYSMLVKLENNQMIAQVWSSEDGCRAAAEEIACATGAGDCQQDDQNNDGQNNDGQNNDGQNNDGQNNDGQNNDGQNNDGENNDGENGGEQKEDNQDNNQEEEAYVIVELSIDCGSCIRLLDNYDYFVSAQCESDRAIAAGKNANIRNNGSSATTKTGAIVVGVCAGVVAVAVVAMFVSRRRNDKPLMSKNNKRSYVREDV